MSRGDFKQIKDVSIDSLLLDTRNARIRAGHDQADCVNRILRKEDQILALAEDIVANGLTTIPILVSPGPEPKTYIVRDGNRRVTALKLLNDPHRWSPDERLKARFEAMRLIAPDGVPSKIDVLFTKSEDAMLREVLSRHSGAMGGVGQLDWSAYLRTVWLVTHNLPAEYKRPGQYSFWAEDHGIDVPDDFPISSLQRFFSKDNLARLGFDINDNDELAPNIREDVVKKIAQTVLSDFATSRVKVADVFVPQEAANYITGVRRMHGMVDPSATPASQAPAPSTQGTPGSPAPAAGSPAPAAADEGGPSSTPAPAPTTPPRTPVQAPLDRNKVFGSGAPGIAVPETEAKAATIVTEMRKLDLNRTPLATALLLRALVEISDEFYRKRRIADQGSLAKNVRKSAEHMRDRGMLQPAEYDIIARLCTKDPNAPASLMQIESLQKMVHRNTHHLDKQFVNLFWQNIGTFVKACWRQ